MAELLVVGSVALDTVETPFGRVEEVLGGAATYASCAASFFAPVRVVGVVGEDFPQEHWEFLRARGIDLEGLQVRPGRTFRWSGFYDFDLNTAHTLRTELNVFEDFQPHLPPTYRSTPFVFLANIDPELQHRVLDQMKAPRFVACDTMNFWIEHRRQRLLELLARVDMVLMNDAEARQLCQTHSLIAAARQLLRWGPRYAVIKKGEHGAMLFGQGSFFALPSYPLEEVKDPTGAGDTFAGGMLGYLASVEEVSEPTLRRAVAYGSVMASFNVEDFSLNRLRTLTPEEIAQRYAQLHEFTHFA